MTAVSFRRSDKVCNFAHQAVAELANIATVLLMASKYDSQRARKTPPHLSLADLRFAVSKTLDDVCEAASEELGRPLTRGALSAIENGLRGASPTVLRALEVAYGLKPGALVTDYEPRDRESVLEATG